ncbi:methyltransferase, FxLD system [Streptomyces sp. NA02950]|uniref:methyltransferase, FxLD system n=1 Tax=Streptomyces sp. NA02950 TaxID=2742137 RepID=UPI0015904D5F|nr:methyltransferase, FxLD system [Streptomyces sp. NA02950]QKV90430.1 methyltransferase, FxLD system [Streptomyces sp. NA02950]QKV97237.1 methyltransferase, FxLD system [Streptomyces sp. NA02950]
MNTTTPTSPEALRSAMVDQLAAEGTLAPGRVEQAMREVPRHAFVPNASLEEAYDPDLAVITKRAQDGAALSCASVPSVVAMMLQQLDIRPGQRILEIGAGTGYNAALLAHLTGDDGRVTTVDIDPEVTDQAAKALQTTGYGHVHVATRDGALGDPDDAPYDRLILTVGAWDLPPAWWDQLSVGGRLVVPLRWRGQTRSVAFVREADHLRSQDVELCGFVPMVGQDGEHQGTIDPGGHVTMHWDADQAITPAALTGVLDQPKTEVWSGATVGPYDSFHGVWLRMTATEPGTCRIAADPTAVQTGLCTPAIPTRSPALVEGDSLAYFTVRRLEAAEGTERRSELGATGHGPTGQQLADRLCEQIRAWEHDRTPQPAITAHPTGTPDAKLPPGQVIDKTAVRLVIAL